MQKRNPGYSGRRWFSCLLAIWLLFAAAAGCVGCASPDRIGRSVVSFGASVAERVKSVFDDRADATENSDTEKVSVPPDETAESADDPDETEEQNDPETDLPSDPTVAVLTYTYDDLCDDITRLTGLARENGVPLETEVIGQSLDGRDLYALRLGPGNAPKRILFVAGMHAREYLTTAMVMTELEHYVVHYFDEITSGGETPAQIFSSCAICLVPMLNPDGAMLCQQGIDALRDPALRESVCKIYESDSSFGLLNYADEDLDTYLRSQWKANARGVDLNRNYDVDFWENYNKIVIPCMKNYKGPTPASEPETRAIVGYASGLEGLCALVSFHTHGEVVYWNCGQEGDVAETSEKMAKTVRSVNAYAVDSTPHSDASLTDWCVLSLGVPAVTVEVVGKASYPLAADLLPGAVGQTTPLWTIFAELFHDGNAE